MKILIIGGHLSPAIAVMENLKGEQIYFVGRKYGLEGDKALTLEYQTINSIGIPFYEINTGRVTRTLSRHTLFSLSKLPVGLKKAFKIIRDVKPDVILGFGGYVSVPIVIVASILKVPVVLHEQTMEAGLANKFLARFAAKVCISYESSREFFPKNKSILTGLPLKNEIIEAKKMQKKISELPLIYITGGSLGSHRINDLVLKNLPKLLGMYNLIHQTGDAQSFKDYEKLTELKNSLNTKFKNRYNVFKFLNSSQVVKAMVNADLVVARAGANTVSELIFLEKPAFLIPLHFSQRNEQLKNARMAKSLGLAEVSDESFLDEDSFLKTIENMMKNIGKYKFSGENIAEGNAAEKIIKVLKNVSKKTQTS